MSNIPATHGDFRIIRRLAFILLIAVLAAPSVSRGDIQEFIPRNTGFEGELDIDMNHESNRNTTRGQGLETTDTFFNEKLVLAASGYVYHPRFLIYLGKIGGGLSQESFKNNLDPSLGSGSWNNVFIHEYEARTLLLPEHPYNLELFALRRNPFIGGRVALGIHPVSYSKGALFTYKQMPVLFRLGYVLDTVENGKSKSDTKIFNTNGSYNKENYSLAGAFSHSDSQNLIGPANLEFTNDDYTLQNQLRFFDRKLFLTSDLSRNEITQQGLTTSLKGSRFAWNEQLNAYLPWDFIVLARYNHFRDNERSLDAGAIAENRVTSTTDGAGFSITHKLYESLQTGYNLNYLSSKTGTGDVTDTSHSVNGTYTKKIPRGRLTASGYVSDSVSDRRGAPTVINEPHSARILDTFLLIRTDIDDASIRMDVRNPFDNTFVNLIKDTHFRVIRVGDTVTIQILAIPPEALSIDPLFVYDFRVTYQIISGSVEINTLDLGYSLKLELFNGYFIPYYNYSHRKQRVLSGFLSGGPEDATSQTAGVMVQRPGYTLLAEYQDYQSRFNPSNKYRAEAIYSHDITPTTYLNARAYYTKVKNLEGVFKPGSSTESGTGADVSIQKSFPGRNLTMSATGSYAQRKYVFDTKTYSVGAALTWRVAKLDISLGANMNHSETALDNGKEENMYQRYYLSVKRYIF